MHDKCLIIKCWGVSILKRYLMFYILIIITLLLIFQITYADNENLGCIVHDIYFLNNFDVEISGKNVVLEIDDDKLTFKGEYVLNNQTEKIVEVVFGLPSDNIENLTISDKNNASKFFRRNASFIEKNYIYEHLPKADKWSTVNLWLKANESRVISIKYDSKIINDSKGVYTLTYVNNIEPNDSNISKAYIIFSNFKPYNIINISNIEVEKAFYNQGVQLLFDINNNGRETKIDYELTDKFAIDRLDFSTSKKLKSISDLYRSKDYEAVIVLCDEYISNPLDSSVDINQVKYVKAEAYRKLIKYDNYFEVVKTLNLNKLYPFRLKYKILIDIDEILNGKIDDPELAITMRSLQNDSKDSNEFLSRWMFYNKKDYSNTNEIENNKTKEEIKNESPLSKYIISLKLNKLIQFIKTNKFIYIIIVIVVFFIGFIIGKNSRRKKKSTPYYTLRR